VTYEDDGDVGAYTDVHGENVNNGDIVVLASVKPGSKKCMGAELSCQHKETTYIPQLYSA
jgi:hypothetical protein